MKISRFTETQIVGILNQAEAGMKVKDLCRKHGISDATYYNWKAKRSGPHRLDSGWTMISAFLHHEQQALERSNETKETYPFT